MKNKCSITISGLQLTVHTDYEDAFVSALADNVTEQMDAILQASPYSSKLDAALLLLLDLTDQNARLEAENGKLKRELETMRLDLEIQRIENEKLSADDNGQA
ncbi:MAG: cell division protein ZapA [Clostridia bacterium]|nr:cell division protein ZapA [Clostridia bacterium]